MLKTNPYLKTKQTKIGLSFFFINAFNGFIVFVSKIGTLIPLLVKQIFKNYGGSG